MKIVTVVGARPQFVKASVVSSSLAERAGVEECMVHTGQHFDQNMSDVFFEELGVPRSSVHLGVSGGGHGQMTARMLVGIEAVLWKEEPDLVLVYGDTNSTLAGALAASKMGIGIAHVEAGLRSFNRGMPEEINRILTDRLSSWLFTPTDQATAHLRHEGVSDGLIHQVGDVMYDVVLRYWGTAARKEPSVLECLGIHGDPFVLATVHRAENTDRPDRLSVIVRAFSEVAREMRVVWPVHPRTRQAIQRYGLFRELSAGVMMVDPQGYLDMMVLARNAAVIATDSGGLQKEAYFHRTPCVTLRDETEWVELIELGWNRLAVPSRWEDVAAAILGAAGSVGKEASPYGNGNAAELIVDRLLAGTVGSGTGTFES